MAKIQKPLCWYVMKLNDVIKHQVIGIYSFSGISQVFFLSWDEIESGYVSISLLICRLPFFCYNIHCVGGQFEKDSNFSLYTFDCWSYAGSQLSENS